MGQCLSKCRRVAPVGGVLCAQAHSRVALTTNDFLLLLFFIGPHRKYLLSLDFLMRGADHKRKDEKKKIPLAPAISWNLRSQESVGRCFRIPWIGTTSWPPRFLRIQFLFSFFCGPAPKVLYAGPRKRKGNCNRNCSDKLSD